MSLNISAKKYCEDLGHEMLRIVLVDNRRTVKVWNVHRNLLSRLESSLPIDGKSDYIAFSTAICSVEILNEFVAWLYNTRRSYNLAGLLNLPLIVEIHTFACYNGISDLRTDCFHAMKEHPAHLTEFHQIYDRVDDEESRKLVSDAVIGFLRYTGGWEVEMEESVPKLVDLYMFALKLCHPLLCNMVMDKLQDVMFFEDSVFSFAEVESIFRRTKDIFNEDRAYIEEFCIAMFHYQRGRQGSCKQDQLLTDDMAQLYLEIPTFADHYEEYENNYEPSDKNRGDPRSYGRDEKCTFHFHPNDESCHLDCDESDDSESESEDEDEDEPVFRFGKLPQGTSGTDTDEDDESSSSSDDEPGPSPQGLALRPKLAEKKGKAAGKEQSVASGCAYPSVMGKKKRKSDGPPDDEGTMDETRPCKVFKTKT